MRRFYLEYKQVPQNPFEGAVRCWFETHPNRNKTLHYKDERVDIGRDPKSLGPNKNDAR